MMEIIEIIGSHGFPIAISLYLLWERTNVLSELHNKQEETSKALTLAVNELTVVIRERIRQ